jgi:hypothetical protein
MRCLLVLFAMRTPISIYSASTERTLNSSLWLSSGAIETFWNQGGGWTN